MYYRVLIRHFCNEEVALIVSKNIESEGLTMPQDLFNTNVARTFLEEATKPITHQTVFTLTPEELRNVFIIRTIKEDEPKQWQRFTEEELAESQKMLLRKEILSFELRIFEPIVK